MLNYGYDFYFKDGTDVLTFPITPSELTITVGSKNKTITLINEGDINILKSPSLADIKFKARFPMRKYPYSRKFDHNDFHSFFNKIEKLKTAKKSFRFIVTRLVSVSNGIYKRSWDTNLLVALEDFELKEDAKEGDDIIVTFKLKQYREYGVKIIKSNSNSSSASTTTSTANTPRSTEGKATESETYIIKSGDCLWNIAKAKYGNGALWTALYEANKTVIEDTANKYRNGKGSSNGRWIYPNTKIVIPPLANAKAAVTKAANASTNSEIDANYKKLTFMESRLDP